MQGIILRLCCCILCASIFFDGFSQITTRSIASYSVNQLLSIKIFNGNSFSPEEDKIVFSSNESGATNVYTVSLNTNKISQLTFSKTDNLLALSYFPQDNRILYRSDNGNENYKFFVLNPDGSSIQLTSDSTSKAFYFGWSEDKKAFFYKSNRRNSKFYDLYKMGIDTWNSDMIYKNTDGYIIDLISKDENLIILRKSKDSSIYAFNKTLPGTKEITKINGIPRCFDISNKNIVFSSPLGDDSSLISNYIIASDSVYVLRKEKGEIQSITYSPNGTYLAVLTNFDAKRDLRLYKTSDHSIIHFPVNEEGDFSSVVFSGDEKLISLYLNSSTSPDNLYVYSIENNTLQRLTNSIPGSISKNDMAEGERIRFKSFDGLEIPGILYKPGTDFGDSKFPAIVEVHGGPGGQSRIRYNPLIQYLVNRGYVVLSLNYRGSSGYGASFMNAAKLKHDDYDLKDCIEAKNYLIKTGIVDENKIGILGDSFGGYLVLSAMTFTPDAFAAGVDMWGISNWIRTLKNMPPSWDEFRFYNEIGHPVKDSAMLYKISPIFHAQNIKNPLIVLQGSNDTRVPKIESDEIVKAVQKNNIPYEYIVFDDEGHGVTKKENIIKAYESIVKFLDRYLKGKS